MKRILFPFIAFILLSVSTAFAVSSPSMYTVDPSAPDDTLFYPAPQYPASRYPAGLTPGSPSTTPGAFNAPVGGQGSFAPGTQSAPGQEIERFQQQMPQGEMSQDQMQPDLMQQDLMQDQMPQGQMPQGQTPQGQTPQGQMQQDQRTQSLQQQEQEEFLPQVDNLSGVPSDTFQEGREAAQTPAGYSQQNKMQPELTQGGKEFTPTQKSYKKTRRTELPPLSAIERSLSENPVTVEKTKPQAYGMKKLTQYGYSFFRPETSGFAPQTDVPVGPDYLINAGDRLVVTVWGSINGTFNLEVNRGGEVALPKVGAVKVAGQRFDALPTLLTATVGRVYKNFHLNVNMGKLRSIKVYVVGEVTAPGDYNVNSLSTVLSALSVAGGPTKNGSLRNIQINRNGKLAETVDLYDFFQKGDKGKDIRLQPGDTVLVPVIGPVAGIAGNVRRPAIYELKGERNLKELLALAGGINSNGYLQRVQLYRVEAHDKKVVTDFNLDLKGGKSIDEIAGGIVIQDLDLVKVLPIDSVLRGYVRLNGYVLRPGDFALKPGMRVSALLGEDNLLPDYYKFAGQIIRLCPPDQHPEVIFFDVSKALKGEPASDLELKEFDRVKIFARKEMEEIPYVKVRGEVQKPVQTRYFENMTVRDLVMAGGNVKLTAYLKNAEITRLKRSGDSVTSFSLHVDLVKVLAGGADNIKLQPFDELTVRRIPNWAESTERYVALNGEFIFPGIYPIYKGERLSSVIERAGGFTDLAYLKGAKFTRELARKLQQQRMEEALNKTQEDIIKLQTKMSQTASSGEEVAASKSTLEGLMASVETLKQKKAEGRMLLEIASVKELKGSVYDVELQGGDRLTVPSDPGGVNVIGDVYNQNSVVSQHGKSVDWYLSQVGGATGDADMSEVYVVKVDGSVISQKNSSSFLFYNSFWGKPLDSGDTVIVPRQYEKTPWLRDIKDIATVIGNIGIAAGVVVAAGL